MVLLDWEKAFDKVDRQGLMEALRRMRVPQKYVNIIQSLYTNTQFNVEIEGHSSTWKTQETGIRQGCPLSPYLFLVVMTVLFADIYKKIGATLIKHRVPGTDYNEVLYADDTICVTTDTKTMNTYLEEIETEGAKYGLKLNRSKCKQCITHKQPTYIFQSRSGAKKGHGQIFRMSLESTEQLPKIIKSENQQLYGGTQKT